MADISARIGQLITGDGTDQKVTITDIDTKSNVTFLLKVVSGTGCKIGVGTTVPTTAYTYTSSDTVPPITCPNGSFVVKSTNGDTFTFGIA